MLVKTGFVELEINESKLVGWILGLIVGEISRG